MLGLNHIDSWKNDGIKKWVKNAEFYWQKFKTDRTEENCIEWLNYRNKIELQNPYSRFKVLYLTSGSNIASCYLDLEKEELVKKLMELKLNSMASLQIRLIIIMKPLMKKKRYI